MTQDEMIEQLLIQVNSLTSTLNAQTKLIAQLNQTIQEIKEGERIDEEEETFR